MAKSLEYTCEVCRGTFLFSSGWTTEQALAEMRRVEGYVPATERLATVCDDCYKKYRKYRERLRQTN